MTVMTCAKLAPEVRAALDEYVRQHSMTISEILRTLVDMLLSGQITPGPIEGYVQARALAPRIAEAVMSEAVDALKGMTYDEVVARYGLIAG
jgi:molybdate-binding protein